MNQKEREAMRLALEALENNAGELRVEGARNILSAALAEPEVEQEPVAWIRATDSEWSVSLDPEDGYTPLYTAPPRREWVSLTDEDIELLERQYAGYDIYRAIEAALTESNDTDDVAKKLAVTEQSRDWYKRRTEALQQSQTRMRDPERMMVCDILANGRLLEPPGNRYATLTEPEVEQEPYCYIYEYDGVFGLHREFYPRPYNGMKPTRTVPVYTAPLRREWGGLTDVEIAAMWAAAPRPACAPDIYGFARAIEATLKEKNK